MSQVLQLDELGLDKEQALKINPNEIELTYIQGKLSQSSNIFRIRAEQSSDLYYTASCDKVNRMVHCVATTAL